MRIVAWNCNMALHRKYQSLLELKPDIAVISECANVELLLRKAPDFQPTSKIWVGDRSIKGLGVFTFGEFTAKLSPIYQDDLPYVAPIKIGGSRQFNLLAVWACHAKSNSFKHRLGPLNRAITAYETFLLEDATVLAGDFNDNIIWDKPKRPNNHGTNVAALTALGFQSAYHVTRGVEQGAETEATIYWRDRNKDGPKYHIDYCFIPNGWTTSLSAVAVGSFDDWVRAGRSDHVPLIVDFEFA